MFVRAYLKASTDEQDASRARDQLQTFAAERDRGLVRRERVRRQAGPAPNCFGCSPTSSPATSCWSNPPVTSDRGRLGKLKADLTAKRVRVVVLDLPTSWTMATKSPDEFTARMFEAINSMLLDMLAAVARKDYDDRRRGRLRCRPRRRRRAATRAARRILVAMRVSPACWLLARHGARSRT
jgi:DNA invertase Pin-like site-specific DNA recombinase